MIDSTARASRLEGDSSTPRYLWAPAGKPVAVSIPLAIIGHLERAAVESFRSLSSRGSEIGGLLFGGVAPAAAADAPLTVTIESFEPVECDYVAGPLYRLNDAELGRLDRVLEQRAASGARAVGFYRSHTRKGLSLDAADLALLDSRFREAHQIALLIRPAAAKASVAGIFIREGGVVRGDASCLEFPFRAQQDSAKLAPGMYDGAVAGPRSVTAAPATPRPAIRAQIVPIASRREIAPEPPPSTPPPPAPEPIAAAPEPVATPAPPTAAPEPPRPAAAEPVRPAPPLPPPPVAAAPVVEPEPEPALSAETASELLASEAGKSGSSKLLWVGVGALVSVLACVGFVLSSGMLHRGKPTIPAVTNQDSSPLALHVDRNGADIVLTWNRDADAIRKAGRAVLQISDGAQHENVDMDLAQLRNGSIVYTPVTGDVVFKMEVSGSGQAATVSESVRVLRTRPSPMPDGTEQQAQAPAPTPAQPAAPPAAGAPSEPAAAPEEEKPVALAQAVRPFHAESLAQRLRPATNSDVPDTPSIGAKVPGATPSVNLGGMLATQAPPPAPAPNASAPAAAAPKPKTGGQIVQAQLLKRRDPEYPRLAKEAGASGVVELIATVGTDGRVKSVQVVKGHPLLRQAAADAVKSWVYRPTLLNGVPIESQTQVLLHFSAPR